MRIVLLYPNLWRNVMPLSIGLFTSLLKREGHEVALFEATVQPQDGTIDFDPGPGKTSSGYTTFQDSEDSPVLRALTDLILDFGPDLLAVSVVEDVYDFARFLCQGVGHLGIRTLWGGVFPTFAPEKAISCHEVDLICLGEGENALVEVCRRIDRRQSISDIPNLWVKTKTGQIKRNELGPLIDPDTLPHPDFGLFNPKRFGGAFAYPVETHRGCPYQCAFCGAPPFNDLYRRSLGKPFFRKLGIKKIQASLEHVTSTQNLRSIFFFADTLLAWSEREFEAFVDCYSDFKLPFMCYARPETLTEKRVEQLLELGLEMIGIGIQHGNEEFRRRVVRRGMTNRNLIRVFDMMSHYPAWVNADSIVGFPDETPSLAMDTVELNRRIKADSRACSVYVPYHGSALRQVAIERGFLEEKVITTWTDGRTHLNMPEFPADMVETFASNFHHWVEADEGEWKTIARRVAQL